MLALAGLSLAFVVGVIMDLFFLALFVLINSSFIHNNWWSDIPAFTFSESFLIGALLLTFAFVFSDVGEKNSENYIIGSILAIFVTPFVIPFIVDKVNDSLITSMPDISGITVLTLAIIGAGLGFANLMVMKLVKGVTEALSDL